MSRPGQNAEKQACRYLQKQGLEFLDSHVSCRQGEIDLIMRDGELIIVVEVRSRAANGLVDAATSVSRKKQERIIAATRFWLARHPHHAESPLRFDVVAIDGPELRWIPHAFDCS